MLSALIEKLFERALVRFTDSQYITYVFELRSAGESS